MNKRQLITLALGALLAGGCARFTTKQTDISYEGERPGRTITTKAAAWTLGDSKSALTSFKATQTDKSQSAAVGGLEQQSHGTNVVAALESISKIITQINQGFLAK